MPALLQTTADLSLILLLGTLGMMLLTVGLIAFLVLHQKRVKKFNERIQAMEQEQQRLLLNASIKLQEEERQRLAADLHDDAGPLLATARLYLNENLVTLDKSVQLQSISQARQLIDDTILMIRNISHSLLPPTLKNFGLELAVNDLFEKINGSGVMTASSRFHDYQQRMKADKELIVFRVVQELINNILKHSDSGFIHLTQNNHEGNFFLRIHHDGHGLEQADFEALKKRQDGLGLKNIYSRLRIVEGKIHFERDASLTYYKVTVQIPHAESLVIELAH